MHIFHERQCDKKSVVTSNLVLCKYAIVARNIYFPANSNVAIQYIVLTR